MAELTVLDASILLAHFDDSDIHAQDARTILSAAEDLAASTLTLAQTLVGATAAGRLDEQAQAIADLQIREVPLAQSAASALARLRVQTGLRLPDCCVLHAAMVTGAGAVATRDERLRQVAHAHGFETP